MALPNDGSLESTLALFRDGYEFIAKRCRRLGTDAFTTRIMLKRAVCVMGEDAARMFYTPGRFTRKGTMPPTALKLLQDKESVNLLDGDAHRHRKAFFLSMTSPEATDRLVRIATAKWRERVPAWQAAGEAVLFDEAEAILCRAVSEWAGVPLTEGEADKRTREFRMMVEGASAVGPKNWYSLLLRSRSEGWARKLIERVRDKSLPAETGTALHDIAWHRDTAGELLTVTAASVELINILRPVTAVARYVVFVAHALHQHPPGRVFVTRGPEEVTAFVQEVRRFYPFFPFVGGRVREPFEWRGHRFEAGAWVLLDAYGTNHDERTWPEPHTFRPERFLGKVSSGFDFIPQGGGAHPETHRCPGEGPTVEIMKAAVRWLTEDMFYDVPDQDLSISLARIPTAPASRFKVVNVRRRSAVAAT